MLNHQAIIEQVALYLGASWKFNRLEEPSNWRFEIIDGSGRGLFFRVDGQKQQFRISGQFPRTTTKAYTNNYKTIGVALTRPAKEIAADITRRLLPHYLEAFKTAKERYAKEQAQQKTIELVAQSLVKVTGGYIASHSGSDQRTVYFKNGEAQIYGYSGEIKLTLNSLNAEQAIKIAATLSAPNNPTTYEVQTYTLCDGWVNTWHICENDRVVSVQVFDSESEAQAELDKFFTDIEAEIKSGERKPDNGYDPMDFRIVPVTE